MIRCIAKLATVYLLLGLMATWAVAWGCAASPRYDPDSTVYGGRYARSKAYGMPVIVNVQLWHGTGATLFRTRPSVDQHGNFDERPAPPAPEDVVPGWAAELVLSRMVRPFDERGAAALPGGLKIETAGWPRRALWCSRARRGGNPDIVRGAVVLEDEFRARPDQVQSLPLALPHLPLWPGLIANTLFYGAVLFCTHQLAGIGRRRIRIRRGLCPVCGYDLGADYLRGCSECGWGR